ncbi:MAG: helix-turn-helix domain-containing protein [Methyloceanibacter sp.]
MSKRNSRKRRGRSTSPFVMLHWHLLDSQGWHALSPYARLTYLELARLYNGGNNGRISLSVRRLACQMPCDKATASRALRELEDAGFIDTMRIGTFTRKDRLASEIASASSPATSPATRRT